MLRSSNFFKTFKSQEELSRYINRPNESVIEEKGQFDFEQCLFDFDVDFTRYRNQFKSIAYFKNARFEKSVKFDGVNFEDVVEFGGCTFMGRVSFQEAQFKDTAWFGSFYEAVTFRSAKFSSANFLNGQFRREAFFTNSKFNFADFRECRFLDKVDFEGSDFTGKVYFEQAKFQGRAQFANSTFFDEASFEGVEFFDKLNAWEMKFFKGADFKWGNFREKINLAELVVSDGILNMHGANFEGNAYVYNSDINLLDLSNSVIEKGIFFLGSKINNANRETYRIIKNEFISQNNRIEALKYHRLEMVEYLKELASKIISLHSFKSIVSSIGDLVVLMINGVSNNYGMSWVQGVIFTFLTTILIFNWYIGHVKLPDDYDFWIYYPQFILPTHKFDFLSQEISGYAARIDFIGRIVSSFGIYQTVQAFRKYGRF